MITGINVRNFKGIDETGIDIDLAPVTLLFGSNSAGKSTIFHSLLYANEVLSRRNLNADRTVLGGESVDLGGFANLVHDHVTTNRVSICLSISLASAKLDELWPIAERLMGQGENEVDLSAIGTDAWKADVWFQVAWDEEQQEPFASGFKVSIDGEQILGIWTDSINGKNQARINYRHNIFRWPVTSDLGERNSVGVLDELVPAIQSVTDQFFFKNAFAVDEEFFDEQPTHVLGDLPPDSEDYDHEYFRYDDHGMMRLLYRFDLNDHRALLEGAMFYGDEIQSEDQEIFENNKKVSEMDAFLPVEAIGQRDALPRLDTPLQLVPISKERGESLELLNDVLSRLVLVPTRLVAQELDRLRHLGPLRKIVPRVFGPTLSPNSARWANGLAAWDELSSADDKLVSGVSEWLSGDERLGTGYSLKRTRFKEVDTDSPIFRFLAEDAPLDKIPEALRMLRELSDQTRMRFVDEQTGIEIDPPDIAVGLNQLLPVVVAALDDHKGVTLIEQPELHNHPSVEVGLGDLFAQTIRDKSCRFILETHGEHLLLRMLRRIRQTTEGDLPEGIPPLQPESIAVYFVEKTSTGVSAERLRIDETGEFIDRWPGGFFRERAKELF